MLNEGAVIADADVPAIEAPLDYIPKTAEVTLKVPAGTSIGGCSIYIDHEMKIVEITERNNKVLINPYYSQKQD